MVRETRPGRGSHGQQGEGAGKGSKTAASKSLKEKRAAKKAKEQQFRPSDWNLNK